MVVSVGHIHLPSAVTGYTTWITELSFATALLAKGAGEGEVRVQDLNMMSCSLLSAEFGAVLEGFYLAPMLVFISLCCFGHTH